jgi:hypothetical protein
MRVVDFPALGKNTGLGMAFAIALGAREERLWNQRHQPFSGW